MQRKCSEKASGRGERAQGPRPVRDLQEAHPPGGTFAAGVWQGWRHDPVAPIGPASFLNCQASAPRSSAEGNLDRASALPTTSILAPARLAAADGNPDEHTTTSARTAVAGGTLVIRDEIRHASMIDSALARCVEMAAEGGESVHMLRVSTCSG